MRHAKRTVAGALIVPLLACASTGDRHRLAPDELRTLQTRSYDATSAAAVKTAFLDAMQEDGFRISWTDPELGLIVAEQESVEQPARGVQVLRVGLIVFSYGVAALAPWPRYRRTVREAEAHVIESGGASRIRVALQLRSYDKNGRLLRSHPVVDGRVYEDLFERLEKGLRLQRELSR